MIVLLGPPGPRPLEAEMTNSLDSLAKLADTLRLGTSDIAIELKVTQRTVAGWIAGDRRPSERNRAALVQLLQDARARHAARRSFSSARDAQFAALLTALQTPQERVLWITRRAQIRAQFAR